MQFQKTFVFLLFLSFWVNIEAQTDNPIFSTGPYLNGEEWIYANFASFEDKEALLEFWREGEQIEGASIHIINLNDNIYVIWRRGMEESTYTPLIVNASPSDHLSVPLFPFLETQIVDTTIRISFGDGAPSPWKSVIEAVVSISPLTSPFTRDPTFSTELYQDGEEWIYANFPIFEGEEALLEFFEKGTQIKDASIHILNPTSTIYALLRRGMEEGTYKPLIITESSSDELNVPLFPSIDTQVKAHKMRISVRDDTSSAWREVAKEVVSAPPRNSPLTFHEFMNMPVHRNALRDLLEEDVVPISEACSTDYSDRFTRPYECMRSFIPGVQQLHKVLAYLRANNANWVLPENSTSPYVRILDDFSLGATHGEYVSLAFETISANKRNTCNFLQQFGGISYCYSTASVKQVNISSAALDFAARGSVIPDLSREGILTHEIRVGIGSGNTPFNRSSRNPITPPVLGPHQNSLGAVMDTGYITIVGGWWNALLLGLLTNSNLAAAGLDGITKEQKILLSNRLDPGARSCEIEGGDPATAEWCILFPQSFFYFDEDGNRTRQQGTSGAVALYNGVFDLLSTIFHPVMSSTETDAVIRSCAVDSTQAGREVLDSFPDYVSFIGDEYENTRLFYGTDGVDSVTGVGKGDLSCLIADDGHLVLDPAVLLQESTEVVIVDIPPPSTPQLTVDSMIDFNPLGNLDTAIEAEILFSLTVVPSQDEEVSSYEIEVYKVLNGTRNFITRIVPTLIPTGELLVDESLVVDRDGSTVEVYIYAYNSEDERSPAVLLTDKVDDVFAPPMATSVVLSVVDESGPAIERYVFTASWFQPFNEYGDTTGVVITFQAKGEVIRMWTLAANATEWEIILDHEQEVTFTVALTDGNNTSFPVEASLQIVDKTSPNTPLDTSTMRFDLVDAETVHVFFDIYAALNSGDLSHFVVEVKDGNMIHSGTVPYVEGVDPTVYESVPITRDGRVVTASIYSLDTSDLQSAPLMLTGRVSDVFAPPMATSVVLSVVDESGPAIERYVFTASWFQPFNEYGDTTGVVITFQAKGEVIRMWTLAANATEWEIILDHEQEVTFTVALTDGNNTSFPVEASLQIVDKTSPNTPLDTSTMRFDLVDAETVHVFFDIYAALNSGDLSHFVVEVKDGNMIHSGTVPYVEGVDPTVYESVPITRDGRVVTASIYSLDTSDLQSAPLMLTGRVSDVFAPPMATSVVLSVVDESGPAIERYVFTASWFQPFNEYGDTTGVVITFQAKGEVIRMWTLAANATEWEIILDHEQEVTFTVALTDGNNTSFPVEASLQIVDKTSPNTPLDTSTMRFDLVDAETVHVFFDIYAALNSGDLSHFVVEVKDGNMIHSGTVPYVEGVDPTVYESVPITRDGRVVTASIYSLDTSDLQSAPLMLTGRVSDVFAPPMATSVVLSVVDESGPAIERYVFTASWFQPFNEYGDTTGVVITFQAKGEVIRMWTLAANATEWEIILDHEQEVTFTVALTDGNNTSFPVEASLQIVDKTSPNTPLDTSTMRFDLVDAETVHVFFDIYAALNSGDLSHFVIEVKDGNMIHSSTVPYEGVSPTVVYRSVPITRDGRVVTASIYSVDTSGLQSAPLMLMRKTENKIPPPSPLRFSWRIEDQSDAITTQFVIFVSSEHSLKKDVMVVIETELDGTHSVSLPQGTTENEVLILHQAQEITLIVPLDLRDWND